MATAGLPLVGLESGCVTVLFPSSRNLSNKCPRELNLFYRPPHLENKYKIENCSQYFPLICPDIFYPAIKYLRCSDGRSTEQIHSFSCTNNKLMNIYSFDCLRCCFLVGGKRELFWNAINNDWEAKCFSGDKISLHKIIHSLKPKQFRTNSIVNTIVLLQKKRLKSQSRASIS